MIQGEDYIGVGCWGVVVNDKEQILLIKKKDNDYWERPGGKVEFGETLEECAIREVEEETSVKSSVVGFVNFEQAFYGGGKKHWIAFCYHLKYISGIAKNTEVEKHDEVKWFSISKLPENLSIYTKNSIKEYLNISNIKK